MVIFGLNPSSDIMIKQRVFTVTKNFENFMLKSSGYIMIEQKVYDITFR